MQRASQWCTTTQHFSNFPRDCLKQARAHSPKAPWNGYFRFRGPLSLCHKQTGTSVLSTMKALGVHTLKYPCPLTAKLDLPMPFIMEYFCFYLSFIPFCVYVRVWMSVCEFCIVHTCVHSWAFAHGNQRRTSGILPYSTEILLSLLAWPADAACLAFVLFSKQVLGIWTQDLMLIEQKLFFCWAVSSTHCCCLSFLSVYFN